MYKQGQLIHANWEGKGVYYPGKIASARTEGASVVYNVDYEDGGKEGKVPEHFIKSRNSK